MKKLAAFIILSVSYAIASPLATYSGPFLFFGLKNLNDIKIPTLQRKWTSWIIRLSLFNFKRFSDRRQCASRYLLEGVIDLGFG